MLFPLILISALAVTPPSTAIAKLKTEIIKDTNSTVHDTQDFTVIELSKLTKEVELAKIVAESNAHLERIAEFEAKKQASITTGILINQKGEGIKATIIQAGLITTTLASCVLGPYILYLIGRRTKAELKNIGDSHAALLVDVKDKVTDTKNQMDKLETNTNNKLDEFIKVKSEAEYAKGLLQGSKDAKS